MATTIIWHGTQQDSFDLVNAIARNCTCSFNGAGARVATCAPHHMLSDDQRALDGLLFARSIVERLRAEEWAESVPQPQEQCEAQLADQAR